MRSPGASTPTSRASDRAASRFASPSTAPPNDRPAGSATADRGASSSVSVRGVNIAPFTFLAGAGMRMKAAVLIAGLLGALPPAFADPADTDRRYVEEIAQWRAKAEQRLRRDLGWLTIAGRWELAPGDHTI